jgi:hypothetical protein
MPQLITFLPPQHLTLIHRIVMLLEKYLLLIEENLLPAGAGTTDVKTTLAEQATLHITHADFVAQDRVVDFTAGGHEFTAVVKLVHV